MLLCALSATVKTPAANAEQKTIVGDERVEAMYADAPDDEKHFQRYLLGNCFDDAIARNGQTGAPANC